MSTKKKYIYIYTHTSHVSIYIYITIYVYIYNYIGSPSLQGLRRSLGKNFEPPNFSAPPFLFKAPKKTPRNAKTNALQGTIISHLRKRKIIDSKVPAGRGHVSSREGNANTVGSLLSLSRSLSLLRPLSMFQSKRLKFYKFFLTQTPALLPRLKYLDTSIT